MRPILFSTAHWEVSSAPVFAGLGALIAYYYFRRQRAWLGLSLEDFWGLMLSLALGAVLGGVGFYLLLYGGGPGANLSHLILRRSIPGGSFLGSLLGAAAAGFLFCRRRGAAFAPVADALGGAAPLGLAVMRLGCLLNGCCYGRPTLRPWGVVFTDSGSGVPASLRGLSLHPTQLYEASGCALIFLTIQRAVLPKVRAGALKDGDAFAWSLLLYALLRLIVDFFRGGDPGIVSPFGLTLAQSAGVLVLAALLLRRVAGS